MCSPLPLQNHGERQSLLRIVSFSGARKPTNYIVCTRPPNGRKKKSTPAQKGHEEVKKSSLKQSNILNKANVLTLFNKLHE